MSLTLFSKAAERDQKMAKTKLVPKSEYIRLLEAKC